MNVVMLLLVITSTTTLACETNFVDVRHLPEDGRAKDGVADYKLNTKLMMELLTAVRRDDDLPPTFRAEVIAKAWELSPVSSVRLTGRFAAPHVLAGGIASIQVHRTLSGVRVDLRGGGSSWQRLIPAGEFQTTFPWRGPGSGLLTNLILGLADNPDLNGWRPVESLDRRGAGR